MKVLGLHDTLDYLVYFESLRETIVSNPGITVMEMAQKFHDANPHSIKHVVLQITETIEQIAFFEAAKQSILHEPEMSSVELVRALLAVHPDTLGGEKVAINIGGEVKLMRRNAIKQAGLNVLDPTKDLKEQLQHQIRKQLNGDDTDARDNDSGEEVSAKS